MKILRNADQIYIAKRLAAIYFIAVHWREESWEEFVEKIVSNVCDIAFRVGGERLMTIGVPAMVEALNRQCPNCGADMMEDKGDYKDV